MGALNLNNAPSNRNSNIGFRPAFDDARRCNPKGCSQCDLEKDAASSAIAGIKIAPIDASLGGTFLKICSFDNLLSAAYSCRSGKTTAPATLKFFYQLEENIIALHNELMWGEYLPSPYHHFYVFEPKRRLISAPHFRDRVVHRAIYNILEPLLDKTYIHDSYACRRGKGAHSGADRAQAFIRKVEASHGRAYALKADISRYFASIDHDTLKRLLAAKIGCRQAMALLELIIDTSPGELGVGIPLGNLTSQIFANVYLHELDRFAKHQIRAANYIRYMDDFVIIHHDKAQLQQWRADVERFLYASLRLRTNSKTQVFPISPRGGRALDFLGYRIYATHRLLRRCSVKRIKTKLKAYRRQYAAGELNVSEVQQKIQSWL
ncbi:MAG: reverse transcriptase/maturase family protein, partial [Aeromonas sp.]